MTTTLKYSPALQTLLAGAVSRKNWCEILLNAIGTNLSFICKRDSDPLATDVFTSGTTFYAASLRGIPKAQDGGLVNLGKTYNATINLAANIAIGKSILRIQGNGHWIEGSLGLLTTAANFRVKNSPTEKTGLTINKITISAPLDLPSGVGPEAPQNVPDTTVALLIEDMSVPAFPATVGTLYFDNPQPNITFEDEELAQEMGDTRVTFCKDSVIFGQFEFNAIRFDMNQSINSEANVPLEQGLAYCKPHGTWPTYPLMDSWRPDRDLTFPKPFRISLLRQDGTVKKVLQMRDGLPINSPLLNHDDWWYNEKPLRPHWNCGMMLPWQSHLPKATSYFSKYFSGMTADSTRPSQCKQPWATNPAIPLANRTQQINAGLHFFASPQWPIAFDPNIGGGGTPALNAQNTFDDPYLYDVRQYHGGEGNQANISGWDYEPASLSNHDWQPYLGGVRGDRAIVDSYLAMYATDPDGVRLKGSVPWRILVDRYGMAMFNHAYHWVTDAKNCLGLPKELVLAGAIQAIGTRYAGRLEDIPGKEKRAIHAYGIGRGMPWPTPAQRDGHNVWNGYQADHLHASMHPAKMVIFFNSIMHLVSASMRFACNIVVQTGGDSRPTANPRGYWMNREHAWRWLNYTLMWKIATKHSLGYSRQEIETNFQIELEKCYDEIYIPTKVTNDPDPYFEGLRRLGIHVTLSTEHKLERLDGNGNVMKDAQGNTLYDGAKAYSIGHDTKTFYLSHLLVLMRQLGVWKAMRAKSDKCRVVLDFLIECLDRYGIEAFYRTNGRVSLYGGNLGPIVLATAPDPDPSTGWVSSWTNWATALYPPIGVEDMVTKPDGTLSQDPMGSQAATTHLRQQYIMMRSIYFPEHPHPLLAATQTMVQSQYDKFSTHIANIPSLLSRGGQDYNVRWPSHGILKPPSVLAEA